MTDVLVVAILLLSAGFLFTFLFGMTDGSKKELYISIILILVILVCWITIRELTPTQNYRIDKNILYTNKLELSNNIPELKFNKKLKVEIMEFDMPYGTVGDYKNYKIYFDSLTCIQYNSSSFDSSHLKLGKKLYKE